jgi:hypothetical protein
VGVIACGGLSVGVISFGGVSVGVFAMGGFALSLLLCWAGIGLSVGAAYCGLAVATLAIGGVAVGLVALGGLGIGLLANGGTAISTYTPETAPPVLLAIRDWVPQMSALPAINVGLVVVFGIMMASMLYGEWRETRRLRGIDPKLVAE